MNRPEITPSQPAAAVESPAIDNHTSPKGNWSKWALLGVLILIALSFAFAHWLGRPAPGDAESASGEPTPVVTLPGKSTSPSLSSDGRMIAFSWSRGTDPSQIYWQTTGETQPHALTEGTSVHMNPVWSPDGKEIAFIEYSGGNEFSVVRETLATHEEHVVGKFSYYSSLCCSPPALDWSPDGRYMLVGEQDSYLAPIRLILVSVSTGETAILTSPPAGTTGDVEAKFSPDGLKVAFHRGGRGDLYLLNLVDPARLKVHPLTTDNQGVRGIAWTPDGKNILYGSDRDSSGFGIWSISPNGGQPRRLTPRAFEASLPSVSVKTGKIVFVHEELSTNLVEMPLTAHASHHGEVSGLTLAPSTRYDGEPVYSPDGAEIAFISTRSGPAQLWLMETTGKELRQLTHLPEGSIPFTPSWAPDQKTIIFSVRKDGLTNVFSCDVKNGQLIQLTFSSSRYFSPRYSRDGRYLFVSSNAEGASRIWRIPRNNNTEPQPLFWDGALQFQVSDDGRFVYFPEVDNGLRIQERDLQSGSTRTIFRSNQIPYFMMGMILRRETLYIPISDNLSHTWIDLLAVNIKIGKSSVSIRIPSNGDCLFPDLDVSPDQRKIVFSKVAHELSDIYSIPTRTQ
ncbi:MAG: hypothetical protein ACYC46_14240 [Acidobacteriaceae bacterium]